MFWEYKTVSKKAQPFKDVKIDLQEFDTSLNLLGKDRWELVSAVAVHEQDALENIIYTFKRPVQIAPPKHPEIGFDIDNNNKTGSQS